MSDHSISIVPIQSAFPDKETKAKEILEWLVSLDIVRPTLSDCVLSSNEGYAISNGARLISREPQYLPFNLVTNGLEITTERQIFDTGENGIEELICPNCKQDIASEDWDFLSEWGDNKSNNLTCPLCIVGTLWLHTAGRFGTGLLRVRSRSKRTGDELCAVVGRFPKLDCLPSRCRCLLTMLENSTNLPMTYDLEKRIWTDADFDKMGWHDNHIYKMRLTADLELDIDYIFKWNPPDIEGLPYTFWVAPATLVFKDIRNLTFEFATGLEGSFEIAQNLQK